jgi:non-heme chloroperoxidase
MLLNANLQTGVAAIRGGVKIPFAEQGDPGSLPVLFLHGYTDSWRSFEGVLPLLPRSIRAIAISQRGHGDADRPMSGYRASDLAADLASLMDTLGVESAVIVGHSMGSYTAQRFAIDNPHRTRGLVLAGSYSTAKGDAGIEELRDAVSTLVDPIDPDFVRSFQESTLAQTVSAELLDAVIGESLKVPARIWREAAESLARDDHWARLGEIRVPALVVWGDRDDLFSRSEQERLVNAIPQARLLVYSGAGHALHWEEPARFARDVAEFAASLA